MKDKLRIGLRYAGYAVLTLVLTAYFMFLTFPFTEVKDRILPRLESALPYRIDVDAIRCTPLLWVELTQVQVFPRTGKRERLLDLPRLRVRPSLLDLLIGRQTFRFRTTLLDGSLHGKATRRQGNWDLGMSWDGVRPGKHPLLSRGESSQLDAALSGDLDLQMQGAQWINSTGTLSLHLTDGSIQGLQVSGFTLPELQGIEGTGKLTLDKRKAVLESVSVSSSELAVSLDGNIDLATRVDSSRLNLRGKIKLSGKLATQYEPMLSGFLRKQDGDGFFSFTLRGTLGKPRFSG